MKRNELIGRREFAKLAGSAALVPVAAAWVPTLAPDAEETPGSVAPAFRPAFPQQPDAPKPEDKLKLTPQQEEAVKKAIERRDRQLAAIRSRTLPYDAEPAFVFSVRRRPRPPRV